MPDQATLASTRGSSDGGFWGSVTSNIGGALGKVVQDVLPAWAAGQLGVNNVQPTNPTAAISNPSVENMGSSYALNQANWTTPATSQAAMNPLASLGISSGMLMLILAGVAVYFIAIK